MPNAIYFSVVSRLAAQAPMVAKGLVNAALRRHGLSPETVTPFQMKRLLETELLAKIESASRNAIHFESTGMGVVVANGQGEIVHIDPFVHALVGRVSSEDAHALHDRCLAKGLLAAASAFTPKRRIRISTAKPDSGGVTLKVTCVAAFDTKGILTEITAAIEDVTLSLAMEAESERLFAELEKANIDLKAHDQLKSDFLSSVSHELRTPLTSIRGFATLIDREFSRSFMPLAGEDTGLQKKSQRIRDNLEIILKESSRLTRLINDVLDLAKIEAGRTEWRDAPIQPEALLRDAVNAAHGMFESKPAVGLHLEIQEGLPPFIGDADRMQQVMVNLLNNAAKFTERGTVTVKAFLNKDQQIQLEVRDTGIGFPAEEAEAIFDKFQQAKQGDTLADRPAGTGLGLAISREIVVRHGGRIWASSEPGKGSVFSLTLPPTADSLLDTSAIASRVAALAGQETSAGKNSSEATGNPKILVVDDDAGVRGYLTQLLQEQNYEVIAAADGQAAIAAAQECRPDLITMDLAMPVMDGRTAILKLRADPELQHIPIMVVSAIQGWDTAGGDLSMAKPLDESSFLDNIHLLMGREARVVPRKLNFLVLHDASESPARTPGSFSARCEADFCSLDELPARIESGFHGMVVIPTHLVGKVDLGLLQATPSLEVMIMPIRTDLPLGAEMKLAE